MEQVKLTIEDQTFIVNKDVLCEHSDYFRAMFSGNYVENELQEIRIDVVDAVSMNLIIQYMEIGLIDLFEHPLSTIGDLAMAANFLQITELIKQIQYTLEQKISFSNWIEIMAIAENASFTKLEQSCAAFGLLSFRNMKPEYIPSIQKLFWYLSHQYLDAANELDVFKFGFQWITNTETGADALLIVLSCLDLKRLTDRELTEIKIIIRHYDVSLAAKMVDCLSDIFKGNIDLNLSAIVEERLILCEKFTERVYNEVVDLIKESRHRLLSYVPLVPAWKVKDRTELTPQYIYKFSVKTGFNQWLEVADKNLWGWSITAWGPHRLVIVCGEFGRGTGMFMKDVKVYDTLKKEWLHHGVELPVRRHSGVAVVEDSLFIIGGVGAFRVVLDSAIIYNLKERTFRKIAKFPFAMQNPAVCVHDGKVYASGEKDIYRYEDYGNSDEWVRVTFTDVRMSHMVSFNGYIYCTQSYFSYLFRFKPDVDETLKLTVCFTNPPTAICNLRDRLLFFTRAVCLRGDQNLFAAEEFTGRDLNEKPKVIWSQSDSDMRVNDVAGSCSLVMSTPPVHQEVSQYHKRNLARFEDN